MSSIPRRNALTTIGRRSSIQRAAAFALLAFASLVTMPATLLAQTPGPELSPAASRETAAKVVRWTGTLPESANKTVEIQFAIYENAAGGSALWTETQHVRVAADGHYSVLLGATSSDGLPQTLFPAGESRWVAAHPVGVTGKSESEVAAEAPRSLLAAVPYAYESVDSEALAGRPATDYVTHEDLKSFAAGITFPGGPTSGLNIQPAISGTGTTNYLPIWTNSTTFGNSALYQTAGSVGIGTTSPTATLDVNGGINVRGILTMPTGGIATKTTGYNSHSMSFVGSTFSSSNGTAVTQTFKLQAVPVGNNTSSPSSAMSLLYGAGSNTPAATGFMIGANGKVTFVSGQTFPGTGTITGITASSPLTGGGTSGAITLGLSTSALETTLNPYYARLGSANAFASSATFAGTITGNSGSTMYAIQGNTSTGYGVQGYATGTNGYGLGGYSTGKGGIGVYANATGGANGSTYPIGLLSHVVSGTGIKSTLDSAQVGQTAILGQTGGPTAQYNSFLVDGLIAGVWGDAANSSIAVPMAVAGTADNGYAGVFENTSTTWSTLYVYNKGGGSTGQVARPEAAGPGVAAGHFDTLLAGNRNGICGIGGSGDLSCTGQIKSLIGTRAGDKTVETYSVQSPENWMEDFGSGALKDGFTIVKIDPDFAETVSNSAEYRIFLTPSGDSKGLYVTSKTPTSFEVHESGGGKSSIAFDYRIVAKRRGFETQRLTDVTETFKAEVKAAERPIKANNRAHAPTSSLGGATK